ncbi:MAG TPA: ABC transporter substrate-binding protein [Burkholderiales bacterium]|nr:ABC transporter substrate-binding protein [Burkholderiales bacterium]
MKIIPKLLLALTAFAGGLTLAVDILPPDVLVRNTSKEVLEIIKKDKDIQTGDRKKLLDLVEVKILPHFNFAHITQLAVGKSWRNATPEQKQALVNAFRTLLVRTYSSALTSYKDQTYEVKTADVKGDDATVKVEINQPGGQPIMIDYSLEKTQQGWKVYDVIVAGISLVTSYRSSFANEINRSGIDGLIKTLMDKNQKLESGEEKPANLQVQSGKK